MRKTGNENYSKHSVYEKTEEERDLIQNGRHNGTM